MADQCFLVVRLSSLGDILHTAPAVAMIRGSFPGAPIDWLVDRRWTGLFAGCSDFREVIPVDRGSLKSLGATVHRLRSARYTCALDFQGLYKSALLAYLSGAPRRIGLSRSFAREGGATFFYTSRVAPPPGHIVDQNRALARAAGAGPEIYPSGLPRATDSAVNMVRRMLGGSAQEFFVVSPGGGWGSKCWPADRYGVLCRELSSRYGFRPVVNYGPGEKPLAEAAMRAAAPAETTLFTGEIPELVALLSMAKFVVAGDTGPLHLAGALCTPVVGLYGATDPARTGPYRKDDVVVCNERLEGMGHKRGHEPDSSMLSITIEQVLAAVERRSEKLR
ncbi:MAG TPA: glycosyltransferase family 9 protein [Candidatus Acidoferrales bacterium]|nr:glycosyltransferase family 9 protein [Candidatus Acidoferrales bacterium]